MPKISSVACNDNYLAITDISGFVHIHNYYHPHPDTDPVSLPIWAIILIVVGSLLIAGGISGFIIYKRKQSLK